MPVQMQRETGDSNYHLFVLATPERDRLRRHLASRDIPVHVHYPVPLHRQTAFAGFMPAPCPNADRVCATVLSLPIHAFMKDTDVAAVVGGVRSFFLG